MVSCERLTTQLNELEYMADKLSAESYTMPVSILGGSSIGQHLRHIIEILNCTMQGYERGLIDYEKRYRNLQTEQDKAFARAQLIILNSDLAKPDKALVVRVYDKNGVYTDIQTNYSRELIYNLEHAIHHMALIKVALRTMNLDITPEQFGVAYSTLEYRKTACAQ